jgi:hypothetical protein
VSQEILSRTLELTSQIKSEENPTNYLKQALDNALAVLQTKSDSEDASPSSDVELSAPTSNSDEYAKMLAGLFESFSSVFVEMKNIRSSYIPNAYASEVPTNNGAETFLEFTDAESFFESYENAFMRMLGMPSSLDINIAQKLDKITAQGNLVRTDRVGYMEVLRQRQLGAVDRAVPGPEELYALQEPIDPFQLLEELGFSNVNILGILIEALTNIYALDDKQSEAATDYYNEVAIALDSVEDETNAELNDEYSNLLREKYSEVINEFAARVGPRQEGDDTPEPPSSFGYVFNLVDTVLNLFDRNTYPRVGDVIKNELTNIILGIENSSLSGLDDPSNFWRFSKLLFPPIQDELIGGCINESSKIVAEPFLPASMRKINGGQMKTSLLEAVIRIRIDAVSGTVPVEPEINVQPASSLSGSGQSVRYEEIAETYGILESLVIVRLFNSMAGLARSVAESIKNAQLKQAETGLAPANKKSDRDNENIPLKRIDRPRELARFDSIMALDDAILFLLGKTSFNKAINYQEGVARNSEIVNAQLMDSLISVITVPGKWAKSKGGLRDFANIADARSSEVTDKGRVDSIIGVANGIGVIDIMAFTIALFSVPEKTLLYLLNERQREFMKLEFPTGFFDDYFNTAGEQIDLADAVNEVSSAAYDAYDLFRIFLNEAEEGIFVVD